jgi:hypothetical protein
LTYLFISPLNVPSLVTEKSHTPPPHAAAAAFVARRRSPLPRTRCRRPYLAAAAMDAFNDDNGETVVATHERQQAIFY